MSTKNLIPTIQKVQQMIDEHTHTSFTGITVNTINGVNIQEKYVTSALNKNIPEIPIIKSDSVMEIGRHLDFHDLDSKYDNDFRFTCSAGTANGKGTLAGSGNLSITGLVSAGSLSDDLMKTILEKIYPVGSIYTTANSNNPNEVLGFGNWGSISSSISSVYMWMRTE